MNKRTKHSAQAVNFDNPRGSKVNWGVKLYTWKNGRIVKVQQIAGRGSRSWAKGVADTWNRKFGH